LVISTSVTTERMIAASAMTAIIPSHFIEGRRCYKTRSAGKSGKGHISSSLAEMKMVLQQFCSLQMKRVVNFRRLRKRT